MHGVVRNATEPPFYGHLPNYVNPPNKRWELVALQCSLTTLTVFIVSLRLYTRFFIVRRPGSDDYTILVGLILSVVQSICSIVRVFHGSAIHIWDVRPEDVEPTLKLLYATQIMYPLTFTAIKVSILLFYLRLSPVESFRRYVKATLVACIVFGVSMSAIILNQCSPIRMAWTPGMSSNCVKQAGLFKMQAIINLTTDLIIALLPIPTLVLLNMPFRQKVAVLLVFCIGLIPCVTLVIRIDYVRDIDASTKLFRADPTWSMVRRYNWWCVEASAGLICASLPQLQPLLRYYYPNFLGHPRKSSILEAPFEDESQTGQPRYRHRHSHSLTVSRSYLDGYALERDGVLKLRPDLRAEISCKVESIPRKQSRRMSLGPGMAHGGEETFYEMAEEAGNSPKPCPSNAKGIRVTKSVEMLENKAGSNSLISHSPAG